MESDVLGWLAANALQLAKYLRTATELVLTIVAVMYGNFFVRSTWFNWWARIQERRSRQ